MRAGPVIILEDDEDDQLLLQAIIQELKIPNPIHFFLDGQQLLDYLANTQDQPFIILCDINMPRMNGLELRRYIDQDPQLKKKAIPFIFLTTDASPDLIQEAYESRIQGFFQKAGGYETAKQQLAGIMYYWLHCLHPHK